jgi:DNA helicase-2/ATP-dependent DNA helicase PcrA
MKDSVNHIYSDLEFSDDFEIRQEALNELEERITQAPVGILAPLQAFVPVADPYQEKVIESDAKTIRMVASAGSGKTQTVLNRVLRQVQCGVNPSRLITLTFDNSAASSLKTKLHEQLSSLGTRLDGLRIQTLNSFGYNFLRDRVPSEFKNVIRPERPTRLIKEGLEALEQKSQERFSALPQNLENRFYVEFFSLLKNELFDPRSPNPQAFADFMLQRVQAQEFFQNGRDPDKSQKIVQSVLWLFMAYERALQRDQVIDFDDQKLRTYTVLRDSAHLREPLQNSFTEIIVDEFQDINRLDFVLIKLLAERCSLVVTGDDDQAIYGFRGCTPDFIIDLEKHLERPVTSYELQMNYRNPPNLIDHANRLISRNTYRIPKQPVASRNDYCEIIVASTLSAGLEAKAIVSFIGTVRRGNTGIGYKDFAVLYRTNAQSLPFQVEFILNDVPYFVRAQDNILENEVLERLLGFLRLKLKIQSNQQPEAKDAVLTIQSYFRFIDGRTRNRLLDLFNLQDDFFETLALDRFLQILPKAARSQLIPAIQEAVGIRSLTKTLDVLGKRFNGLRGMIGSLEDVLEERVPLGEIYEVAANFKGNTKEFVRTMERALERARQTGAGRDENGVALLTYFKSKGLQWHTVILSTCNDGLIPHKKAPVEDERRLFYVAMTRASSNLFISYVKKSCNNAVAPSRFIAEAGLMK